MKGCTAIRYLLRSPYLSISEGSIVDVQGHQFEIKKIIAVSLLNEAVVDYPAVYITAWGKPCEEDAE